MRLAHKIALAPTLTQINYFERAAGTSRFVWNWALAEYNRQYSAGVFTNILDIKKQFNSRKYAEFPWLSEMHRDTHSQPFANLNRTWNNFFLDIKAGRTAHRPKFKKKGKGRDSFYVANDKIKLRTNYIRIPRLGYVKMTESLRFEGKILGATISRTADKWFISIQVDVGDETMGVTRSGNEAVGVDLGIKTAVVLSTGETIRSPRALKVSLRRLQIRGRRLSRKIEAAKKNSKMAPGDCVEPLLRSSNQRKAALRLARQHARIVNIRKDFIHKLTTRLCRENQAIVIEDLNVLGMLANHRLAFAISDVGFGEIRRQLEYKSVMYKRKLIIADRWYPSSKLCNCCGYKNENLKLKDRNWTCIKCDVTHDRDINAALNLRKLATITALPEAMCIGNNNTWQETLSCHGGEVTPVRNEISQGDYSGQEERKEELYASF